MNWSYKSFERGLFQFILIVLGFVLVMVLVIAIFFTLLCGGAKFSYNKFRHQEKFNSVLWQAASEPGEAVRDDVFIRCNMYRDLVKNHLHFNMNYKEVVKLLGKPIYVEYYINPQQQEFKLIVYDIGRCKLGCSPIVNYTGLPYSLILYFDRGSKLIAFGHEDDAHKKSGISICGQKFLFGCAYRDKCTRYVTINQEKEQDDGDVGASICTDDQTCERYKQVSPDRTIIRRYDCHISEVKSKWGYEVW